MSLTVELALVPVGFIAGYVDSIAGGGGLLTVPALLTAGVPPHMTLGTNKFVATWGTANSARIFIQKKIYNPKLWFAAIIASLIGAAIGAALVHFLTADFLYDFMPLIIGLLVIYMLLPKKLAGAEKGFNFKPEKLSSSIMASLFGFYDGFFGPGTGSFWVVALMHFYKMDLLEATAVTKLMNFLSNIAAFFVFMCFGTIAYKLGILMAIAMVTGAYFGAHSAIRFGSRFIRPVFLIVVSVMAINLAYQHW